MSGIAGAILLLAWATVAPKMGDARPTATARWLVVWFLPLGGLMLIALGVWLDLS